MKYVDAMMLTVLSLVPVAVIAHFAGTPEWSVRILFAWAFFVVPGLMVASARLR